MRIIDRGDSVSRISLTELAWTMATKTPRRPKPSNTDSRDDAKDDHRRWQAEGFGPLAKLEALRTKQAREMLHGYPNSGYDQLTLDEKTGLLRTHLDLVLHELREHPDLRVAFEQHALMDNYLRVTKNRSGTVNKRIGRELKEGSSRPRIFGGLPRTPPKLWPGGDRSKSKSENFAALVLFLDQVYGCYMHSHRDVLRKYIFQHDRKCYRTIQDSERAGLKLPENLRMPTVQEKLQKLLKQAVEGTTTLSETQKRSVFRAASRRGRKHK
jgi:hypothetical protein